MAILELLANTRDGIPVGAIAAALRRSRAEIYRMLVVLEALEYIHKTDDGRWDLTGRLFDLATRHTPKRSIVAAARPVMEELAEKTLQSCHLMIHSGEHMVCIAREESPAAIGFTVQVGFRPPMLQSTSGCVYYAFQGPARQKLMLQRMRSSTSEPGALKTFVATAKLIARRGYLQQASLLTAGIEDLAAPIFGVDAGHAMACLTIPFISHRLFEITPAQALPLLQSACLQISQRLQNGIKSERRRRQAGPRG